MVRELLHMQRKNPLGCILLASDAMGGIVVMLQNVISFFFFLLPSLLPASEGL
uniref:Uncharacterized protein n=1 Tax=Anguilla anguilla TaxID=7936 RepID=A0A0E9TKB6_ANGAN